MVGRCSRPGGGGPGGEEGVRLERGQGQGFTQHLGAVVEEGAVQTGRGPRQERAWPGPLGEASPLGALSSKGVLAPAPHSCRCRVKEAVWTQVGCLSPG